MLSATAQNNRAAEVSAVYWPLKPQQPQEQPDIAPDALYQRLLASTAATN